MDNKTYTCPLTDYSITIVLQNDVATIISNESDYLNAKAYCLLLRRMVTDLKKNQVQYIALTMDIGSWEEYIEGRTSWEVVCKDGVGVTVVSKIDDFLENIAVALGLSSKKL